MSSATPRLLICSEAEADLYAFRRGRDEQVEVRIIRGRRCAVMDRCMAEFGAAMQLPYCFEGTWDSLRQSLLENPRFEGKLLIFLITNIDRVLPRSNADLIKMLEVLGEHALCNEKHKPFGVEIILHAEERASEAVQNRLKSAGIAVRPMDE